MSSPAEINAGLMNPGATLTTGEPVHVPELVEDPAQLEHRLSITMRGVGRQIAARPDLTRALVASDQLAEGLIIHDEAGAAAVADLVATVIEAEKIITEQVKLAIRIPQQMEAALKETVQPVRDRLAKARQAGNEARVAYQGELRRQAARAAEKARQEAAESAKRAAQQAAERGDDDVPPEAEVAAPEVPRVVSGGTGKMGTQIRMEPVELVDHKVCPKEWLQLVAAPARAMFLAACAQKGSELRKPEPGESVVWRGVRFRAVESAVNRRG